MQDGNNRKKVSQLLICIQHDHRTEERQPSGRMLIYAPFFLSHAKLTAKLPATVQSRAMHENRFEHGAYTDGQCWPMNLMALKPPVRLSQGHHARRSLASLTADGRTSGRGHGRRLNMILELRRACKRQISGFEQREVVVRCDTLLFSGSRESQH